LSTTSHARARAGSPLGGARKYLACLVAVAALFATFSAVSQSQPTASAAKVLASKARCDRNSKAGTINFVSPFAFDASAGIMDVFMAQKLGYFDNLCLKVKINAASFTGEQLVSSGRAQVTGIGSAADHILSVASGANLEAVATYGATDPHAILTNSKITSLKQLEGGTLGYYTNMNPGSLAMLAAAHVDVSKIKLIKLTNFDPTVVTRGQIDGLVGYSSNQGTTLKAAGQPYHAFYPRQFGVKGTYNIMQFNKAWLAKHRDVAADFMRADLKALAYCLTQKAACVNYISDQAKKANQGAAFSPAHQLAVWNVESKFITSDPLPHGVQTAKEWATDYALTQKYGHQAGLTASNKVPPLASLLDTKLVAGLYRGKTLIWPGS
jgi:NitT/TauT family transport system substrate-binding protein